MAIRSCQRAVSSLHQAGAWQTASML